MATTIEQQVALDEALVPSIKRLRIERSNFRLPSDIQSKESTLQVVYNVLRGCPFFKAFLVTADGSCNSVMMLREWLELLYDGGDGAEGVWQQAAVSFRVAVIVCLGDATTVGGVVEESEPPLSFWHQP
nr:hypothetical protein [Tanacetum cinerariifolium]